MDKFVEFAPSIIVIFAFFVAYRVFVTPEQMSKEFRVFEAHIENKFVQKETYNVAIDEIKADIAEMKEKIDRMYNKLMAI